MKKSITKLLARMAKDGDIETVAEFIGEMLGEETETPAEAVAEAAAEAVGAVEEAVEAAAEEPAAAETPAVTDEDGIAGIIERLDKLIALLTPAGEPAADEDPAEDPDANAGAVAQEISGIVEEVVEAAAAEETEPAEAAAEVAALVESILEPAVSTTLEETEGDCGDPDPNAGTDALRAAFMAVRPALARMPRKQRQKVAADIAARIRSLTGRNASDSGTYAALAAAARRGPAPITSDLGKRIMASRNPNYKQ